MRSAVFGIRHGFFEEPVFWQMEPFAGFRFVWLNGEIPFWKRNVFSR